MIRVSKRKFLVSAACNGTIGIRREDFLPYERRSPLTPANVASLVKAGHVVKLEPSGKRAYSDGEYVKVGAELDANLEGCDVIFGVKQIPIDSIVPNSTSVFFSHTIKAQPANMPLLDTCLRDKVTLVDYECIAENGERKVAFGHWAGVAGAINSIHFLGKRRLLSLGHNTPLTTIIMAGGYVDSVAAKEAISAAGRKITEFGLSRSIEPLTFVITGSGRVAQGAMEILDALGVTWVDPSELKTLAKKKNNEVFATVVEPHHHLIHEDETKSFPKIGTENWDFFLENNKDYSSNFNTEIAPHMSCLINCLFWAPGDPKIMTNEDLQNLVNSQQKTAEFPGVPFLPQKLQVISDISADSNGSLEFVVDCTSMEEPFEIVDGTGSSSRDPKAPGVVITSIDYLPALLPREASDHFGNCLLPFIDDLLNLSSGQGDVCPAIRNAVICQNGALTTQYRYISDLRAAQTSSKSILVLGAGYVSAPVVDYLSSKGYKVTIVSSVENEAAKMISQYNFENCTPVQLDCVNDNEGLSSLISAHELTISLLPYVFHPHVCEHVIKAGKQMVTASYLSDGMAALDEKAKKAGITVMNEVGVDPGIDHMLAMELFDELKENGEDVKSFVSFCGGLPAPEASNNVLGYKFSWSPRGVLLNTVSGAKWLHNGDVDEILPGGDIINRPYTFSGDVKEVPFSTWNGYSLEGLPNRDSTKYTVPYEIPKCETLLRGTFRYAGYCEVLRDLQAVNLINEAPSPNLYDADNWLEFMALHLGLDKNASAMKVMAKASELKNGLGHGVNTNKLAKLGIFTKSNKLENRNSPLDALAVLLNRDMQYGESEKDAIIMRHEVKTHQNPMTTHGVDFIYYGNQGKNDGKEYSAMAQTVGYPAAISAHLIMEGVINKPGMLTPVTKDIYVPILDELKKLGIVAKRTLN